MSNVIRFLENMGRAPLSVAEYSTTVAAFDINEGQKQALLDRDHASLNQMLGGRPKVFFGIAAADEEA